MIDKDAKIYVAGHRGLVGSAIWNNLKNRGYNNLVGRSHSELDLLDRVAVKKFFDEENPEYVVLAAAHVGGIMATAVAASEIRTVRRDLVEFRFETERRISAVYDAVKDECVKKFRESVIDANIKRIDRNLSSLLGVHENFTAYFNTQIVLQRIKDNLRILKKELKKDDDFGLFSTT